MLDEYHERLKDNVVDVAPRLNIKDRILQCLKEKIGLQQLHIHVDPKLQAKTVPEDRRKTDLWLSDPWFLRQCLPQMRSTLQHLCIVDYGQQAIIRSSSIIKILSQFCKYLFHSFSLTLQMKPLLFCVHFIFELLVFFSPFHKFKLSDKV